MSVAGLKKQFHKATQLAVVEAGLTLSLLFSFSVSSQPHPPNNELNELPSHVAWKLVSSLKKENLVHGRVALQTVPKQAARNLCPRGRHHQQSVGFSQCGGLPFEIKEREQIFDLEIKAIFRKNIYLAAEGIISTAERECYLIPAKVLLRQQQYNLVVWCDARGPSERTRNSTTLLAIAPLTGGGVEN
ncbi:hypothetical protein TURU_002437 [Turdus rufiventris]|nr:hypothetical protein TURU_002437 [Turdus rufiventris]